MNKTMIESLCNGTFTSKMADDAWQFFKVVAENTLEWESFDVKQPTPPQLPPTRVVCVESILILRLISK